MVRRAAARLKIRRGTTKYLLKKAMEPWLPRELLSPEQAGLRRADGGLAANRLPGPGP